MIYLTKRFHFSASHRLYKLHFTNKENERIFGKCSNPNGHGHNYILEVTIAGEPETETGYVMDLKKLKQIVNKELIEKVDHKNLNLDVKFLKNINPTAENIVAKFWDLLEIKLNNKNGKLYSLRLFETENNIVEYKGK